MEYLEISIKCLIAVMNASCMKVARHNYRAVRKGRSLRQPRRYLQGINPDTGGITQVLSVDLLRAYDQCTLLRCTVERASHKLPE